MMNSLIFCIHENQLRTLEETVETWRTQHSADTPASEVVALVHVCLGYPAAMAQLWNMTFDKMREGEIGDLNELHDTLLTLFDRILSFLKKVRDWAGRFESNGHRLVEVRRLEAAVVELQRMKDQIFQHWTRFEAQDVEEGLIEHARGECEDLDDAFAGIAGVDRETWLKRVQDYRRDRKPEPGSG